MTCLMHNLKLQTKKEEWERVSFEKTLMKSHEEQIFFLKSDPFDKRALCKSHRERRKPSFNCRTSLRGHTDPLQLCFVKWN